MALTKVGKGGLDKGAIKDQTNLGAEAADTDEFLLYDASSDGLKAIQSQNVVGPGIITNKTAVGTGAAANDLVLIYDTSTGSLKKITQTNLLNFPTVTSISPTNVLSGDGTGNHTIVITGQGFSGATAKLINNSGSSINFDSQTVNSATQITGVVAKSSLPGSGEPYDVNVTAATGLASSLDNALNIDQSPVFSTAAGSLGTVLNSARSGLSFTVAAADPESGGDPVYTLESGSIPAGLSFASTSSGAVISGTADAQSSNTTSTFTIRAKDAASNVSDRIFSITVNGPQSTSFTSSGTFAVPSGVSSVDVLVVGGGGAGGKGSSQGGGGGGAGGLIYRPGFTVTPGGTITVTVGSGGGDNTSAGGRGDDGQDSVFGTLTAKGGGAAGCFNTPTHSNNTGQSGGSGGGGSGNYGNGTGGTATQPTQPGESGQYGFGNPGGRGSNNNADPGGGGGGAGAAGEDRHTASTVGGQGGAGKAYTIADGSTSVYYAGGGGGGEDGQPGSGGQGGQGGQGGGGDGNKGAAGQDGSANRGGGGGGNSSQSPGNTNAGSGGKGIVIVRY